MNGGRGLLRSAGAAAAAAADRPQLWLPGSVGSLAYLAWLPLPAAVAPPPRASDFAFLGARLLSSGSFPWNVVLLAALGGAAVLLGCLIAALAEAALLRATGRGTPGRSLVREMEVAFSVLVVAMLPCVAMLAALVSGIATVAPAEFGAPDVGGPLLMRIAAHLLPLLVGLAVVVLVCQALGAVALRRAVGPGAVPVGAALKAGMRDVAAQPARRIGVAGVSLLADLLTLVLAVALLRVLWAPISVELAAGQLVSPHALLLLVGFVAVWLALVLAFGALHAWVSGWWSLELGQAGELARPEAQEAHP